MRTNLLACCPKATNGHPAAKQRDELAAVYPNHVKPRTYVVTAPLKCVLASLAYFARCHSPFAVAAKPEQFLIMIEEYFPNLPKIELKPAGTASIRLEFMGA
jgi:hypothetical protein